MATPLLGTRNLSSGFGAFDCVSPLRNKTLSRPPKLPAPAASALLSCGPQPLLTVEAKLLRRSAGSLGVGVSLSSFLPGCHFLFDLSHILEFFVEL